VEGEGFVVGGDIPAEGEARFHFLGDGVIADERIQEEADESAGGCIFRDERVEGGRFPRGGVDENASSMTRFDPSGVDALRERGILPSNRLFRRAGEEG